MVLSAINMSEKIFSELNTVEEEFTFYVGTYTDLKSQGIYVCSFNTSSGKIKLINTIKSVNNPSFLIISSNNKFLYCVNEISQNDGFKEGFVSAYSINEKTGSLEFLNLRSSGGTLPCHLAIDKNDRFVIVTNYKNGIIGVFPINNDGSLYESVQI